MTLFYADGFDLYSSVNDALAGINMLQGGSTPSWHATNGRFGGGCLQGTSNIEKWWMTRQFDVGTTGYVCFAYWHDGGGGSGDQFLYVFNTATNAQCMALQHNAAGDLSAFARDIDPQAGSTATAALTPNTWVFVELKFFIGNGTGTMEVHVNGVTKITATGLTNFRTSPNDGVGHWGFGGASSHWRIDDLIMMDDQGSTMNGFLGDTRIQTFIPNGAGTDTDFTANTGTPAAAVGDALGAADDDTTYIKSQTATQKSSFTMTDIGVTPSTIWGLQMRARCKKSDAGSRTCRTYLRSVSAVANGADIGVPSTYCWIRSGFQATDPNTSAAWIAAGLNAVQMGVQVQS